MLWYEKLHDARLKQGLSQRELGDLAGMHFVQISRIERGEQIPTAFNLYKICNVLNLSIDWVLAGVGK